jgi:hypothetical protein
MVTFGKGTAAPPSIWRKCRKRRGNGLLRWGRPKMRESACLQKRDVHIYKALVGYSPGPVACNDSAYTRLRGIDHVVLMIARVDLSQDASTREPAIRSVPCSEGMAELLDRIKMTRPATPPKGRGRFRRSNFAHGPQPLARPATITKTPTFPDPRRVSRLRAAPPPSSDKWQQTSKRPGDAGRV